MEGGAGDAAVGAVPALVGAAQPASKTAHHATTTTRCNMNGR
jgi:hypothetical protein